ncbi:hypothetical protein CJ216_04360 [Gardnerella greenwoodii]|uniref:Uncharacterized protein n=1 Tax=Gardnerella greenwoodii TaxID=2914925 RepID=A0A2N6RYY9_9BIFI|nr:hypothetical protein CJ216_04360 [Gardnerella greenwoodii]
MVLRAFARVRLFVFSLSFAREGSFLYALSDCVLFFLCFAACANIISLRKIKKFSNLLSGIWLVLRSGICSALKRVNMLRRNEWRDVAGSM